MEVYNFGKYDYQELRTKALSPGATQKDIDTLGEWFSRYYDLRWNGEYYDVGNGLRLFPVYATDDGINFEIVRYEFR